MTKEKPIVAIVGTTGAVGMELMSCLQQRDFPLADLRLFASSCSAGKTMQFRGSKLEVQGLNALSFVGIDLALFSAGGRTAKQYAPIAMQAGAIVVDNSPAFRMDRGVPLVIPEINAQALAQHHGLIANPNCCAIIAITPLWAIHRRNRVRRLILSTYQAASGAGAAAMRELEQSTRAYLDNVPFNPRVFPHPSAFNVFSHDTPIDPATGFNEEETKVMQETRKIFADSELRINATCIRVPVLRAHCASLSFECERPISAEQARGWLDQAPGVAIVDDAECSRFPMPDEATGSDDILVGRIRSDPSDPTGRSISMFVAGDQLRKGAALNAVQIAESLVGKPAPRPSTV